MDHTSYAAFNIRPGRMYVDAHYISSVEQTLISLFSSSFRPDLFLGRLTEKPRILKLEVGVSVKSAHNDNVLFLFPIALVLFLMLVGVTELIV